MMTIDPLPTKRVIIVVALFLAGASAYADDFAAQCADRAAIERVYHAHRTSSTQSFEEAMPHAVIEQLVRLDERKAAALKQVYGITITPAQLDAEVARINTTTHAPDVLAEIKHALGDDAARFASAMARPILVERELRAHFDNDDTLHAAQSKEAELARAQLMARQTITGMHDVVWQLTPRPADAPSENLNPQSPIPARASAASAAYSNEATAQVSQVIAAPDAAAHEPGKEQQYFADLDPELQRVLKAQLQKRGDVSAVIEMPEAFLVFITQSITAETLSASSLTIAKRSYDEWLAQQPNPRP